jgi:hypothetical protein
VEYNIGMEYDEEICDVGWMKELRGCKGDINSCRDGVIEVSMCVQKSHGRKPTNKMNLQSCCILLLYHHRIDSY